MSLWHWVVLLQIVGFAAMIAEVFLPSAGLLIALMIGSTGLSIWLAYEITPMVGTAVVLADLLLLPIAGWYALSKVPSTPAALRDQLSGTASDDRFSALVGSLGVCETDLRPVGRVRFDSDIVEAQAHHGFLSKGTSVRASRVEGGHLFVEPSEATRPAG